jgi:anti-anti-sigma regulatory factor
MFAFEYKSGIPVLLVQGDVDVMNVDEFESAVQKLESLNESAALISLERSPFVCVHAFGILLARGSRAAARGQRFIVISPQRSFHRKVLHLLHFPYDVADSVEQALKMLRRLGGTIVQI